MALATICDRCGTIYKSDNNEAQNFSLFSAEKRENPLLCGEYRGVRVGEMLDLCGNCQSSLEYWFESGKKGADQNV